MATPSKWAEKIESLFREAEADGMVISFSPSEDDCGCCSPTVIELEIFPASKGGYNQVQIIREVNY